MITYEQLKARLNEDAPVNSVGTPSGVSPPAAANATCTNVPKVKSSKVLNRKNVKEEAEKTVHKSYVVHKGGTPKSEPFHGPNAIHKAHAHAQIMNRKYGTGHAVKEHDPKIPHNGDDSEKRSGDQANLAGHAQRYEVHHNGKVRGSAAGVHKANALKDEMNRRHGEGHAIRPKVDVSHADHSDPKRGVPDEHHNIHRYDGKVIDHARNHEEAKALVKKHDTTVKHNWYHGEKPLDPRTGKKVRDQHPRPQDLHYAKKGEKKDIEASPPKSISGDGIDSRKSMKEALEVMADEKPKVKKPEKTHEILRHGIVVARVNGLQAAIRKKDRLDQEYGASVHNHRPIKK